MGTWIPMLEILTRIPEHKLGSHIDFFMVKIPMGIHIKIYAEFL